jgi:very-short-patch-repair endonuclease
MRAKSGSPAQTVASVAASQHGVVSRTQLQAAGLSSSGIQRWVERGHLHRIHRGVFAVGHPRLSAEGRWLAAVLACGPGAALSHGPAGQLLGIIGRRERLAVHVSAPTTRTRAGIVTHRPRTLLPADITVRLRIPVTTGTRTIWDLATRLGPSALRRAFDQAEKHGILDRDRLAELLADCPSHKGAEALRALLAERALPLAATRSRLEELLLEICREHSLPLPAVNVPVLGYEADFLWHDARLIVETDGADHLAPDQRNRDNERDIALARGGYIVRRYGWAALGDRTAVAAEIRAIIAERVRA